MSTSRKRGALRHSAAVAVLCAGVVLAACAPQPVNGAGHPPSAARVSASGAGTSVGADSGALDRPGPNVFIISGQVNGLYPGASLPLMLTVSNPNDFTIVVMSIATTVGDASAACPAANLTVSLFAGHLFVPGHGTASQVVMATLQHSAPDACQGAVFPLAYSGIAVKP